MVGEIYELKNKLLGQMAQEVQERGIERLDKEKVDMVKDLAEAEKNCWKAEYYRAVTEAMEGEAGYPMGGNQMGYNGMSGSRQGSRSGGMGTGSQNGSRSGYRDSMGRYARRGYGMSGYPMDELRMQLNNADPQQREQMMQELRQMVGQM